MGPLDAETADDVAPLISAPDGRQAVRRLAVARFASTGGSQAAQIALAYTVYDLTGSAAWVSAALIASAGIVGVVGPPSGRLSDRFDRRRVIAGRLPERCERRSLIGGTTAMAFGLGSIAIMPGLPSAIAVGTIGGVGSGIAFTPWFSLLQRSTPDAARGTAFAMAETFEQTSFIAGMVVAGFVVEPLGAQATYLLPGTLLLLATTVSLRLRPTPTLDRAPSPAADVR